MQILWINNNLINTGAGNNTGSESLVITLSRPGFEYLSSVLLRPSVVCAKS